jgi:hypothetical protein
VSHDIFLYNYVDIMLRRHKMGELNSYIKDQENGTGEGDTINGTREGY